MAVSLASAMIPARSFAGVIALVALAAACSGGGGASVPGGAGVSGSPGPATRIPGPRTRPAALQTYAQPYESNSDYDAAWGLKQIDAATAYARIAERDGAGTAPGAGARVAVIDNGIDTGHWEFTGLNIVHSGVTAPRRTHGTLVASVIAAQRNPSLVLNPRSVERYNFHGVAWGIDRLEMHAINLASPSDSYRGISVADVGEVVDEVARLYSALTQEADFVNMSIGTTGLIENYRGQTPNFGTKYDPAVQTLAQASAGAAGKAILVIAAGNAHGKPCESPEPNCIGGRIRATSPELIAGLPVLESSLRDHVVAVVATDPGGRIASFSNRCGIAAKWCIAAPGDYMWLAGYAPADPMTNEPERRGYVRTRGTSFAAPHVTGGLAVLKHWFRSQMKNEELLARLYKTARVTPDPVSAHGGRCPDYLDTDGDRSRCELSSIFGHGVMDLGAATAPVGTPNVVLGNNVGGRGEPVRLTGFFPGGAMGNALARSFAGRKIVAFDELGAPFWFGLDGLAYAATRARALDRLEAFLAPAGEDRAERALRAADPPLLGGFVPAPRGDRWSGVRLGYLDAPQPAWARETGGGHLALAGQALAFDARGRGFGATVFSTNGMHGREPVSGALVSWRADPKQPGDRAGAQAGAPLKLTAGWIGERETMLGSRSAGAFGRLSAGSAFVGFDRGARLDAWRFDASAEFGMAHAKAGRGMLTGVSPLYSSAFALRAARPLEDGSEAQLSVAQPLRVEAGRARFSIPVGRTKDGRVLRRTLRAGLAPSGRQIDLAARWRKGLANGGALRLGAIWTHQPGHDAAAPADLTVMAGYRHSF